MSFRRGRISDDDRSRTRGDLSAALFADGDTREIPLVFLTALLTPDELRAKGNQLAGRAAISKHAAFEDIVARVRAALP